MIVVYIINIINELKTAPPNFIVIMVVGLIILRTKKLQILAFVGIRGYPSLYSQFVITSPIPYIKVPKSAIVRYIAGRDKYLFIINKTDTNKEIVVIKNIRINFFIVLERLFLDT